MALVKVALNLRGHGFIKCANFNFSSGSLLRDVSKGDLIQNENGICPKHKYKILLISTNCFKQILRKMCLHIIRPFILVGKEE